MYKVTYNIAKVSSRMNVNITFYFTDENSINKDIDKEKFKTIKKIKFNGDTFVKFSPRPFMEIVIDPKESDMYVPYKRIKLGRFEMYKFGKTLETMEEKFKTEEDLFYYYEGRLKLNEEKKKQLTTVIQLRDRVLQIEPAIIVETDTDRQHEGILIYINVKEVYCYLTYLEMGFLKHLLLTTDIDSTGAILYMINNNFEEVAVENKAELPEEDLDESYDNISEPIDDSTISNIPKQTNTIPNI